MTTTNNIKHNRQDKHIIALLKELPIPLENTYVLIKCLLEELPCKKEYFKKAKKCIQLGLEAMKQTKSNINFYTAIQSMLISKSHLRSRTLQDIHYVCKKIIKQNPNAKNTTINNIDTEQCIKWLSTSFQTPSQFKKGRSILHSIFNYAIKRDWCTKNPVTLISKPIIKEQRITPLSLYEVKQLIKTSKELFDGECLIPCAIMLFAGIRPTETKRLTWDCINMRAKKILIHPQHSKTGGCRQVSIQPILEKILLLYKPSKRKNLPICPHDWDRKWRIVRKKAGLSSSSHTWQPDVLRHTFASYHLSMFCSKALLQEELGHSTMTLIHSTYVSMNNITPSTSKRFWKFENIAHLISSNQKK